MVVCTGCGDTKDATQTDSSLSAGFNQTKGVADSLYSCMQFREAYDLYLQLLNSEEAKTHKGIQLDMLNALCLTSELSGHKAEQNKWLRQLLDQATQANNDYYHSLALISMGVNVFYEGDRELGIQYVSESINLMDKTDRPDTDHLTHGHLIMLARLYGEIKDYDNALKTCERNLRLTMDGTRWGNVPNLQLIDRRMALAKMAGLLAKTGDFQRADSAYAAWKAVKYEGNHTRDYFIVDYLKRRGRYQEAIPIYNDLIRRLREQGDTLGEMMNTAKWGLADVSQKMGHYKQAADLYEQVLEIQDTLKSRKARNTAQELAAVYHAQEQEQTIMRQEAENARQRYTLSIVFAVLFGLIAFASIVIVKNRTISRKNRVLARQISQAVNYNRMYWDEKSAQKPATAIPDDTTTVSDEELFNHINEVIVREQLFLDPKFERQTIMDRFNLSKERAGAVFSKGSSHSNLTSYIQQLRLEAAAKMLSEQSDKSIVQIASDCGFGAHTYFSFCFRQHFGMSPTDYRREALKLGA